MLEADAAHFHQLVLLSHPALADLRSIGRVESVSLLDVFHEVRVATSLAQRDSSAPPWDVAS